MDAINFSMGKMISLMILRTTQHIEKLTKVRQQGQIQNLYTFLNDMILMMHELVEQYSAR